MKKKKIQKDLSTMLGSYQVPTLLNELGGIVKVFVLRKLQLWQTLLL